MVAYRQTYEIIRGIQEKAAEQCAPVIFGIKPSNLLIIDQCYAKALKSLVETTGLKVRCFEHRAEKQVWFMFREEPLYRQLAYAAKRFREYKRGEAGFPHEMGILLGYPLGDVKGFIEHHGRDCLCSGYWKVYENEEKARETFRLYARVKQIAMDMVKQGMGFGMAEQYQFV